MLCLSPDVVMFWSSRRILPLNDSSIPAIVLNKVVLPAPFGPKTTCILTVLAV